MRSCAFYARNIAFKHAFENPIHTNFITYKKPIPLFTSKIATLGAVRKLRKHVFDYFWPNKHVPLFSAKDKQKMPISDELST